MPYICSKGKADLTAPPVCAASRLRLSRLRGYSRLYNRGAVIFARLTKSRRLAGTPSARSDPTPPGDELQRPGDRPIFAACWIATTRVTTDLRMLATEATTSIAAAVAAAMPLIAGSVTHATSSRVTSTCRGAPSVSE